VPRSLPEHVGGDAFEHRRVDADARDPVAGSSLSCCGADVARSEAGERARRARILLP
jgi:hypothetical protein